uniref:Uncharacterized protein n=1 Tax=Chlamydomonas euryale TaxID=1486919 RepID=A0A7R9V482_9CHLO|mmetsp:Transcript_14928/g.43873  ORF Transcript_14928/g.43873 Transcript_14928/m.43873 type:complete len:406 (+) Transcript_14928:309-1526(+)
MGERAALNAAEAEFLRGVLDDPPDEREWQASRGLPHGGSDAEPSSSAHERSFGGSWQRDHEAAGRHGNTGTRSARRSAAPSTSPLLHPLSDRQLVQKCEVELAVAAGAAAAAAGHGGDAGRQLRDAGEALARACNDAAMRAMDGRQLSAAFELLQRAEALCAPAGPLDTAPCGGGGGDGGGGGSALDAHERRRARLEAERAKREAEIRAFQQQHFREMQEAALRNRAAIQRDIGDNASAAGARAHDEAAAPCARVASGGLGDDADGGGDDFAAMVKDMADLLTDSLDAAGAAAAHGGDADIEEDLADVLAGRFLLNGEPVALPVQESDTLGVKMEALRAFLEDRLGAGMFVKVYRRLESLTADDDEGKVSKEFLEVLGAEKLPYLALVHQLIVCEEQWEGEAHRL